jgi:phage nucleotide-binding protein
MTVAELRKSLEVKPPAEAVEWINALFYGDPGAGKTYLLGTAEDSKLTSPVLIFDVEGGLATIRHRSDIDVVKVRSMKELTDNYNKLYRSIEDDKMYYKTVGIDSLSELTDVDMRYIMKEAYGRNPDKVDEDVPSQREWGKARAHMRRIVRAFRDLPCNVIFTAQVATLQEEGQPTKYFPGFAGKLRTELPGFVDVVGYLYPEVQEGVIVRKLQVTGTRRVVAKDRTSALGDILENTTIPEMWDLIQNHSQSAGQVNSKTPASKTKGGSK